MVLFVFRIQYHEFGMPNWRSFCCFVKNGQLRKFRLSMLCFQQWKLKRLTPAPRTTHWSPLHGLPYGLPLIIDQIPFFGVEKYKNWSMNAPPTRWDLKQPPFSFRTSWSSLFHFRPILHQPPSKTLFPQWRIGKRYWIFIFLSCLNCLLQPFVQS